MKFSTVAALTLASATLASPNVELGSSCTPINFQQNQGTFELINDAIDVVNYLSLNYVQELNQLISGTHSIDIGKPLSISGVFNKFTFDTLQIDNISIGNMDIQIDQVTTPGAQSLAGGVHLNNFGFSIGAQAHVTECFKYIFTSWCKSYTASYSISTELINASGSAQIELALASCSSTFSMCTLRSLIKDGSAIWNRSFDDVLSYVYKNGVSVSSVDLQLPTQISFSFLTASKGTFTAAIEQSVENILTDVATWKPVRDLLQNLFDTHVPSAANSAIKSSLGAKFVGDCDGSLLANNKKNAAICNAIDLSSLQITQAAC